MFLFHKYRARLAHDARNRANQLAHAAPARTHELLISLMSWGESTDTWTDADLHNVFEHLQAYCLLRLSV